MSLIALQRDLTHAHCNIRYAYIICGSYSRAATITANSRSLPRLFEGDYYSKCGVYSRKYGISNKMPLVDSKEETGY